MNTQKKYKAVVIGTGFGGAVAACRLSIKWPDGQVLVLERGKRYKRGEFPRSPNEMTQNFWNVNDERVKREKIFDNRDTQGLFDVSSFNKMDVVRAAGLGGGSLIYANVFMEMPDQVYKNFPASISKKALQPYYDIAREVMGICTIPKGGKNNRPFVRRRQMYRDVAKKMIRDDALELFRDNPKKWNEAVTKKLNGKIKDSEIAVFFGNDPKAPLKPGKSGINRYGAEQTSCTYCTECDLGCNIHSKNTLDLNYLWRAEKEYGAEIRTECMALRIVPLDDNDDESRTASGSKGFRIYFRQLDKPFDGYDDAVIAEKVVVSAGTLGTNDLLLRCRDQYGTLPNLSDRLGQCFSGNGDFQYMTFEAEYSPKDDIRTDTDINSGPVITTVTDFGLFNPDNMFEGQSFILEDAGIPSHLSWVLEGANLKRFAKMGGVGAGLIKEYFKHHNIKDWGNVFQEIMESELASGLVLYLLIGLDAADGTISLDKKDNTLCINWPQKSSSKLYEAFKKLAESFGKALGSNITVPMYTWAKPYRKNITVHPLGGCALGDSRLDGVVSSLEADFGKVHGYENLFIADASLMPCAIGSNPAATILALSEKVCETITNKKVRGNPAKAAAL